MEVYDVVRQWRRNQDLLIHLFFYVDRLSRKVSFENIERFLWYAFHDALGGKSSSFLCDTWVWIKSDETSSERCDENRRFAERQYDALSRRPYWYWPVVGMFMFVCGLYVIAVGIVIIIAIAVLLNE